jgi:hypothetical protein
VQNGRIKEIQEDHALEAILNPKAEGHIRRDAVVLLWTLVAVLYVSLASQWITTTWRDKDLAEYMNQVIRVAANEHRDVKETRALILMKASQLSLPVRADDVRVSGAGQTMTAAVHFKADISMPIVNQCVYTMVFNHHVKPAE